MVKVVNISNLNVPSTAVSETATAVNDSSYLFYDEQTGQELMLPVNPEEIRIKWERDSESVHILNLGDVEFTQGEKLEEITFESFFPAVYSPSYCRYTDIPAPLDAKKIIDGWKSRFAEKSQTLIDAVRFIATGAIEVNMLVTIGSVEFWEKGGEPGDIYYTMTLRQWRPISVRTRDVTATATTRNMTRPRPQQVELIMRKGLFNVRGALRALSLRYYFSGSKVDALLEANRETLEPLLREQLEQKKVILRLV